MDFSAFASGAPLTALNAFPEDIYHKKLLMKIRHLFETTEIPEEELVEMIYNQGGDDVDVLLARRKIFSGLEPGGKIGTVYHRTHPDYEGFRRLLKYSKYIHGKFWFIDENLNCPGLNYRQFVQIMKEEKYSGYVASEYEGHIFDPTIDNEEQIARHIRMMEKLWEEA